MHPCDKKTRDGMKESPHLSGMIPISVQQRAKFRAVRSPHLCDRKYAHVKQEASISVPESYIGSDENPSNIWGSGAQADPGGSTAIVSARHEAPALLGHQQHQLSQKSVLNQSAATYKFLLQPRESPSVLWESVVLRAGDGDPTNDYLNRRNNPSKSTRCRDLDQVSYRHQESDSGRERPLGVNTRKQNGYGTGRIAASRGTDGSSSDRIENGIKDRQRG